jgi:alcohol dehydrogenase class IV
MDRSTAELPMREFHVGQPTRLAVGRGMSARLGTYAATYGSRALVVTGSEHARRAGLVDRVLESLAREGMQAELIEGVGPNPTVALVDAGAMLARMWRADVVIAVGGGSVIDVAKAIATSAAREAPGSFAEHLSGLRPASLLVDSALPVVAVPTLPGSGSESNGTSVITDDATGRKLSAHSDLAAPRIALLDPELVADAPRELVAPGLADAYCHALEAGLSTCANIASDALAEQALRMLTRVGMAALDTTRNDWSSQLAAAWWASNLAGQALTLAGSLVTHPLAHPLSARLDARHGEAVAALEGAVVAVLADRFTQGGSMQRVAGWLDVRRHDDPAEAVRGVLARTSRFATSLGVRSSVTDLGLTEDLVDQVVRDALASGSRGLANVPGPPLTSAELGAILRLAGEHGPTTRARQLLEAAAPASS